MAIWVVAVVNGPEDFVGQEVLLQQLVAGAWQDRATTPLTGDGAKFSFAEPAAVTVRVVVSAAGLISPEMALPAAPALGASRYYVRSYPKGSGAGGRILRVYEDGTVYGINYGGMEYSCEAGTLKKGLLTLKTFDFDGSTDKLRTSGSWKNLKIRDKYSKAVQGARKSLSGKNLKLWKLCAAPIYAAVTSDPSGSA